MPVTGPPMVWGNADLCTANLPPPRFIPQLPEYLRHLGNAGGPQRVSLGQQPPAGADRHLSPDFTLPRFDETPRLRPACRTPGFHNATAR